MRVEPLPEPGIQARQTRQYQIEKYSRQRLERLGDFAHKGPRRAPGGLGCRSIRWVAWSPAIRSYSLLTWSARLAAAPVNPQ
jgi:hypothetical protein